MNQTNNSCSSLTTRAVLASAIYLELNVQEASPIDLVDVIKTWLAKSATWSGLLGWLLSKVMAVFVKISLFLDCIVQHPNISTLLYWTQDLRSNMAITIGWVNVQWIKSWILKVWKRLNRSSKPQSRTCSLLPPFLSLLFHSWANVYN